jgi:hypothetical protein
VFNSEGFFGQGHYVGHDEPSLAFYSSTPGSGNAAQYQLTLPSDPPTRPQQDGSGGTFNFQLHPTFWFGMVLCDGQSYPEYTSACTPNSDANIFENPDINAPDYLGHHPGSAFLELQFYPPGWVTDCAQNTSPPNNWCAALHINSVAAGIANAGSPFLGGFVPDNSDCVSKYGVETTNSAYLTHSGQALNPAHTLFNRSGVALDFDQNTVLLMHSGDRLEVAIHDTPNGVTTVVTDLTTHKSGSMTASPANGYRQVDYQPQASTCTTTPFAFHPMYSTSSELTRAPWAPGTDNVAFSDEIGHFEYCPAVSAQFGRCTQASASDPSGIDFDDRSCAAPPFTGPLAAVPNKIGGCLSTDIDFDGVAYQPVWPGTNPDPTRDARLHATPITFSGPLANGTTRYERAAFETAIPLVEAAFDGSCDVNTGAGCTNPPPGANFYPIYSTANSGGQCVWQFGGPLIPGTTNAFGGNATVEYGPLTAQTFAVPQSVSPGGTVSQFDVFYHAIANPC